MKGKTTSLLSVFVAIIFLNLPVYATGYEDVNLMNIFLKLVFYLFVFILVIALTILGTRFIGKNFKGLTSSKYIQLLDTINLPGGSKIVITKINDKIYILSTNNSNTNVLDIIEEKNFNIDGENFENYITKYLNKNSMDSLLGKLYKKKDKEDAKDEEKS